MNIKNLYIIRVQKINAFTVLELVVVMLISAILFGIAYFSLEIIQRRYQIFSLQSERLIEINTLQYLLSQDFKNARYIKLEEEEISCRNDSSEILYVFNDSSIMRIQNEMVDTFKIQVIDPKFLFGRKELENSVGLIDYFSFSSMVNEEKLYFSANKQYDTATLMQAGF